MLLSQLIGNAAARDGGRAALRYADAVLDYAALDDLVNGVAGGLLSLGLGSRDRVAVYLPKQVETVAGLFGASTAGGTFVPVNPALRAGQVGYILRDCNVRVLITSADRMASLGKELKNCPDLRHVVVVGDGDSGAPAETVETVRWEDFLAGANHGHSPHRAIESDMAAIFYTSGSTGQPKGVVLSHRNMVVGAVSVAEYLENTADDHLLSVAPLSFDYGFSQLTTAFHAGASVTLMNHLFARDIPKAVAAGGITGLACVPPLWIELSEVDWPEEAARSLRYITSTGGRMPHPLVQNLRELLPETRVYLMYGLTEAFRSTFLPPDEIDARPNSIGRAIPNAEILVVRPDGSRCEPGEAGELVHRGPLVGLGYWNDPERTAERYRPAPGQDPALPITETAVWSGDLVKSDEDGYLYFVGRNDDMIKTSGYRVSPTELEECIYRTEAVGEVAAIGLDDDRLGQRIVIVATAPEGADRLDRDAVMAGCRTELPSYMLPSEIIEWGELPRNPNGKIDRKAIAAALEKGEKAES